MSHNQNPYAKATGVYDNNAKDNAGNQRELEGRILLKSNRQMQKLQENWDTRGKEDLGDILEYNRQIWMLFYDTALENKDGERSNVLRSNIVNLANFIFKKEMEILSDPQKKKLDVLININREIAAGLMVNNEVTNPGAENPHIPRKERTTTDISG